MTIRFQAALLVVSVMAGCASVEPPRPGDGSFSAGDFAGAVVAYEEVVRREPEVLADDPELVERLAWARAVPGHAGSDPARARELLEQLLDRPEYRSRARALLALVGELEHLQRRQEELATEVAALGARLRQGEAAAATCDARLEEEVERAEALEAKAKELAARARRLADELDAIKRIDLGPPS